MVYKKKLSEILRNKIEALDKDTASMDGKPIYQPDMISHLYEKGGKYLTAKWSKRENIDQLLDFIRNAHHEGLNPDDYHISIIESLMARIIDSPTASMDDVAQLELMLTDAFLLLSSHLAGGKTDQLTIDPNWHAARRGLNIEWNNYIDSTLKINKVNETLHKLTPNHRQYANLKKALANLQELEKAGGWKPFTTAIKKLEKGMTHPDVASLRNRLAVTQGPILPDSADENFFDQTLHYQVEIFQIRSGLNGDGVIGKRTVEELNVPVEYRIATIEANLERWRWLSDDLGVKHILVNIANFDLQLVENGNPVFVTEVIVGRPFRETPVFSSMMTYLVFNPEWTVPPTILSNDVIPAVVSNPNYLAEKQMKIITRDGMNVDATTIDWNKAALKGFPYMIRQEPGANNALGRVKFMFPNKHDVYIHDTPSRNMFRQNERNFSSGCIRMNKPLELAQLLLNEYAEWTKEQIDQIIKQGKPRTVRLPVPVPVHLVYMTAWANDDGVAYFRRDVYNRDQPLLGALKKQYTPSTDEAAK